MGATCRRTVLFVALVAFSGLCVSTSNTSSSLPAANGSALYKSLFQPYSPLTPVFHNVTDETANPLVKALLSGHDSGLTKRDTLPTGTCAPGTPCSNGACCSNTGVCSYAPTSCGADVCISDCDAKAPCGEYADPDNATCPLNVCCSQYGFCGSTDDFCGTGCQEGFGGCGAVDEPSCAGDSTSQRTIGYYESWATQRPCDVRSPEDLDVTAMTHVNFAFAFFDPVSFQMMPMDSGDPALYSQFTALKKKKASLQCFISIGGWSFNDAGNVPNTRTAFSDMVSTKANRQAFITSVSQFLQTYSFDGIDLDWEYPAASDRGGVTADTANFVLLLEELRAAFGTRYGISVTLPSSYWYLQGFDVNSMQNSLDWFNFMSYDIHGVWDSTNQFTGPYVRPHTNWTEIAEGLDLLWRAGVSPDQVVLGIGWYGRSFTLSDASCTEPNGVCLFAEGGLAGPCTQSAGTLSAAEIDAVIAAGGTQEGYDEAAAVKWITWDSTQWVSFDDGETMQLKVSRANALCLGGTMIWSLDQDDASGSALNDLLGIGTANGVSTQEAEEIKEQMSDAQLAADIASSCYWTLCGQDCTTGYFEATYAQGQIAGIARDSSCSGEDVQTLCCAPGTTMGTCQWEGWRGVGLACSPACNDTAATIVARNTNHYDSIPSINVYEDQTCNGGFQAYCCTGFEPSSKTNAGSLVLYGQNGVTKRDERAALVRRGKGGATVGGAVAGAVACAAVATVAESILAIFTFGLSLLAEPASVAACAAAGAAIGYIASGTGSTKQPPPANPGPKVVVIGKPVSPAKTYGQWEKLAFTQATKNTNCDCSVTYTCRYNVGGDSDTSFDEVCDNQKWAIDKGLHGQTVFHYKGRGASKSYSMTDWKKQRTSYQKSAQASVNRQARCQVDEFPMGSLQEARKPNPQFVRLLNGPANGRQGLDFQAWTNAVWKPCSTFRHKSCNSNDDGPPITWVIGDPTVGDARLTASSNGVHFIQKYGWDSQTANSLCFATYTSKNGGNTDTSTVLDHGFRAMVNDPMFTQYHWPQQDYKSNPANVGYPTDVNSNNYLKRDAVQTARAGNSSEPADYEPLLFDGLNEDVGALCEAGLHPYVDAATGEIVCFSDEDMIGVGHVGDVDQEASGLPKYSPATTTAVPVEATPSQPQSGQFLRGSLPTSLTTTKDD